MLCSHEYLSYFFIRLPEIVIAAGFSSIPPLNPPPPAVLWETREGIAPILMLYTIQTPLQHPSCHCFL